MNFRGTECDGELKKFCRVEGIHFYCTTCETNAVFAKRSKGTSKLFSAAERKKVDTIFFPKNLNPFQPWISEKFIRSTLHRRKSRVATFCPFRQRATTTTYKTNAEQRHKVRISRIDSTFREVCRTRLVQNVCRMVAMASRKPQYTQRRMNRLRFYVGFLSKKSLLRPFDNGTLHKRVSFSCICKTTLRWFTQLIYRLFDGAT